MEEADEANDDNVFVDTDAQLNALVVSLRVHSLSSLSTLSQSVVCLSSVQWRGRRFPMAVHLEETVSASLSHSNSRWKEGGDDVDQCIHYSLLPVTGTSR